MLNMSTFTSHLHKYVNTYVCFELKYIFISGASILFLVKQVQKFHFCVFHKSLVKIRAVFHLLMDA